MSTLSVPVYSSGLDDCTSEAVIVYAPRCLAEKKEIISQSILQPKKRLAFVRCLGDEITAEEYKRLRELSHTSEYNHAYLQKQKEAELPLRECL
jgi:hypothetical protein